MILAQCVTTRRCLKCKEEKLLTEYHFRQADILKRQRRCKKCNQSKKPAGIYSKKVQAA